MLQRRAFMFCAIIAQKPKQNDVRVECPCMIGQENAMQRALFIKCSCQPYRTYQRPQLYIQAARVNKR